MTEIDKLYIVFEGFSTDNETISYFEDNSKRIFNKLIQANSNPEKVVKILHQIALALNNREKYAGIYYLFLKGYKPICHYFTPSNLFNELKFELGKGLHHNMKYKFSKQLFNELAISEFDVSRIEPWWNQSVYKTSLENIWLKNLFRNFLFGLIFNLLIVLVYFLDKSILILVPLITLALIEPFFIKYYYSILLKENENNYKIKLLNKEINLKIMIDVFILSIYIAVFFIEINWFYIAFPFYIIYEIVFHYFYLNFKFFPKSIVELNKQRIDSIKRQKNNSDPTK
jgi:hypothetical protein